LAEPAQFADGLAALSAADVRRIMRDNTHDLLAP
jgi:hypothetical protein